MRSGCSKHKSFTYAYAHQSLRPSSRMWTWEGGLLCRMSLCQYDCNALSCFKGIWYAFKQWQL